MKSESVNRIMLQWVEVQVDGGKRKSFAIIYIPRTIHIPQFIRTTSAHRSWIPCKFFRVNFEWNFCRTCKSPEFCTADANKDISNEWFCATLYTSKREYTALAASWRATRASLIGKTSMDSSKCFNWNWICWNLFVLETGRLAHLTCFYEYLNRFQCK